MSAMVVYEGGVDDKGQRQALREQIWRATRYWRHEWLPFSCPTPGLVNKDGTPTVRAYERGVSVALGVARATLLENAGRGWASRNVRWFVNGCVDSNGAPLTAMALSDVGGLLSSAHAPDDNAVDVLVQLGIFGGVVFG